MIYLLVQKNTFYLQLKRVQKNIVNVVLLPFQISVFLIGWTRHCSKKPYSKVPKIATGIVVLQTSRRQPPLLKELSKPMSPLSIYQ